MTNSSINQRLIQFLEAKFNSLHKAAEVMEMNYQTFHSALSKENGLPSMNVLLTCLNFNSDLDANWLIRGEEHGLVDEIRHLKLKLADQAEELGELKNIIVTDTSSDVYQQLEQIKEEINLIKKSQAK